MRTFPGLGVLICLLAACSQGDEKYPQEYIAIYSPNGEPLNGGPLGRPTCEEALGGWFDRLSAGGKGHISALAFLNDAQTQFKRMDIDHNNYIVSEELDRFRAPYHIEPPKHAEKDEEAHKGKRKGNDHYSPSDPSLSLSDPVMSADTNLDFKVSPGEFSKQAEDIFSRLDTNHDNQLDRAEVMTLCQKKEP